MKFSKNGIQLIGLNADTCISNFKLALAVSFDALHPDLALVGIANGVRNEVCDHLSQQIRVAANHRSTGYRGKFQPLALRLTTKLGRQPINEPLHREVFPFRFHRTSIKPADVQQGIQEIRHCRQRRVLIFDHSQRTFVFDRTAQGAVEQTQGLYRLSQIMARCRQKGAVRLVRPLRCLLRGLDILFHLASNRDVTDNTGDEPTALCLDRAEANLHRKFTAVFA